ncbi:hypothetical protein Mal48_39930 [Thalassoglobus polymorphus]|uniref:Secreted protein n=1 Tax=Thalassoglobus polymorphus TaxID=2527994 RepID=A0A517QSX2_9PLAN|nr:hypothetical protein Mal48_39930 [Thalassoglobus polymorphus]
MRCTIASLALLILWVKRLAWNQAWNRQTDESEELPEILNDHHTCFSQSVFENRAVWGVDFGVSVVRLSLCGSILQRLDERRSVVEIGLSPSFSTS